MQITVYHRTAENAYDRVAVVEAPTDNEMAALEYAYRWTNNIEGSWSMKIGADANDNVTVTAPLPVHESRTYGLRSTSMFDRMVVNGKTYKVAMVGFTEMETV